MLLRIVVAAAIAAVVLITVVRGVRAADWQLLGKLPGENWAQRGPVLDAVVACETASASDAVIVPAGTALRCQRIISTKEATR